MCQWLDLPQLKNLEHNTFVTTVNRVARATDVSVFIYLLKGNFNIKFWLQKIGTVEVSILI